MKRTSHLPPSALPTLITDYAQVMRHRAVLPAPNEDDIALLMSFGFDRNTVIQVLRSSGNNADAAANTLLGH